MIQFPESIPTDALMILIDKIRGKAIDNNLVYQAAWNLAGYAIAQVSKSDKPVVKNLDARTDDDDALTLEALLAMASGSHEPVKGIVPWGIIIEIALRILKNVLE